MGNETLIKNENGNDANRLLAAAIIQAVLKSDWSYMLSLFPEGVEHRTCKYKVVSDFDDWETYEDFARYVYPAQSKLIELCLNKALECLSKASCVDFDTTCLCRSTTYKREGFKK